MSIVEATINPEPYQLFDAGHDTELMQQFLTFTLGEEEYGVDIMQVREVKGWVETTRLPNEPQYVRGVLNLRGMILPIFDLRARFTGALTEATPKHVIVILAVKERIVGVLADSVSDIITVNAQDIKPAPDMDGNGQEHIFINGLIALEDRMVVLLDMDHLIDGQLSDLSDADQYTASCPSEPVEEYDHV